MIQGTVKFVQYREKLEIEKFEIEKGYSVFLTEISREQGGNFKGMNILFETKRHSR